MRVALTKQDWVGTPPWKEFTLSIYFEIAFAAASRRLCLFLGTGFSKAITNNKAPNWKALLERLCDLTKNSSSLKGALFPKNATPPLSLEEAAEVIAIELSKEGKNIQNEIATIIKDLKIEGNHSSISEFMKTNVAEIITTNYDLLAEELLDGVKFHSICPGRPVPRSSANSCIYHIHGSINKPSHMVVTSNDYFKFMNTESYFSKKLSTALHENTVIILGYSLSDTNLKSIINGNRSVRLIFRRRSADNKRHERREQNRIKMSQLREA